MRRIIRGNDGKEPSGELSFTNPWMAQMSRSGEGLLSHPGWERPAPTQQALRSVCFTKKEKKMYADCFQTQSRVVPVWKPGSSFYLQALFFLQALRRCGDTGRLSLTHPPHPSFFSSLARLYHPTLCTLEAACTCA